MSPTNRSRLNQHVTKRVFLCAGLGLFASQVLGVPKIYDSDDVSGDRVLAIWQFKPGAELKDGKGEADLSLKGSARVIPDEIFGGALECFSPPKGEDKLSGATTARSMGPTPSGAFVLEAWVKLKAQPTRPDWSIGYILDKMYIPTTQADTAYNKDYFFRIQQDKLGETVILQAGVGLGTEVILFSSEPVPYAPDVWRHMAFVYNGRGTGMLFVDEQRVGMTHYDGKGAAAPGPLGLSIGDRVGSSYFGLPGYLAQVRISQELPTAALFLDMAIRHPFQRTAFERMERDESLLVTLTTADPEPIHDIVLTLDNGISTRQLPIGDLNGMTRSLTIPLPCTGKAGAYKLKVTASGKTRDNQLITGTEYFSYNLCNRLPEFMPVVMWGVVSSEQMMKVGFTHSLLGMDQQDEAAWFAGKPLGFTNSFDRVRSTLDTKLVEGLRAMGTIAPSLFFSEQKKYEEARKPFMGQDSAGQPGKKVDFSLPRIQQFGFDVGRTVANNVYMFPALDSMIIDSELRDGTLSFREEDRNAFKAFSGYDFPEAVNTASGTGVKYGQIDGFPRDRIIADDNKILTFYRWFWGGGDGFPGFLTQERKGLAAEHPRLHIAWDPAVRCPSKWGSGGQVDWISHWTYVYPDPLVMGLAVDELFAMAKGGPSYQQVSKMTQLIWYRSVTTGPLPEDKSKWAEWERRLPDAKFITIPPDMLEIAFWQKLSRPVRSIMYHGAGSLWEDNRPNSYDFTNPETAPRLSGLIENVVRPLGPTLLHVPDRPARVAMLESFASQMFYGGITYGNMSGPVGRMYAVLARAHLQSDIVYDETILRDGLDRYSVLVMPSCAVLTESVFRTIRQWQHNGGIIVADTQLAPALSPDILIRQLDSDKKEDTIAAAKQLRSELEDVFLPYAEANTPEAILRVRSFGTTDYLFALNDHRMFGDYLGQHGKVMEKGLPTSAELTVRRPTGTVYDLLQSKAVETVVVDGVLHIPTEFGPGQGQLFMIVEHPIAGLTVTGSNAVHRSGVAEFSIAVTDDTKQLIDAVIPLRIDITDAQGASAEYSGWYAAVSGALTLKLNVAPNDAVGVWTVKVRDLASGQTAQTTFSVESR